MLKMALDIGHGGSDPGAVKGKRTEANDVLRLGCALEKEVEKRTNKILIEKTRSTDVYKTLQERTDWANKKKFDFLVSVHRDSFTNKSAKGITVYIYKGCYKGNTKRLADIFDKHLDKVGFQDRNIKEANFHMLRESNMPAILIECGFISNEDDNKKFDKDFDKLVDAMADATLEYCKVKEEVKPNEEKPSKPSKPTDTENRKMYRIRKEWKDTKSQIGAYTDLNNAIAECKKHKDYEVYDDSGKVVYPESKPSNPSKPKDNWVLKLQKELNKQGFKDKNGKKLVEDGLKGELTLSACPTLKYGAKGNITGLLQEKLNDLGYSCGKVDKAFGDKTKNALAKFQKAKKISADSICGQGTWRKILGL